MKVLILTEGGRNIGFGHITRCVSLYQAFAEKGIIPKIIVNGDETIESLLKGKNYQIFNWFKNKEVIFDIIRDAGIVIVDSYLANYDFYKNISETVKIPVYVDDNKRLNYRRGIVINANIYAEKLEYQEKDGIIYLLGPKYAMLRREFWKIPEKEIKDKVESILVTFGGDDAKDMTPKILKFLNKEYPEIRKNVVMGRGFKNTEEVEELKDNKTKLIYSPNAEEMKKIMIEADIAISSGGQTLYELARLGMPTIGICLAENQLLNLKGWANIGFLEFFTWYNDRNLFKKTKETLKKLNYKKRIEISQIGRKFVDGQGAGIVMNEILKVSKKRVVYDEIKITNFYNKDKIYLFLRHVGYRKFNLWLNITDKNIVDLLFKEINGIQSVGKIFVASQFDKITSLLAVKPLDWDSQHYGFKCVKIEYILTNKTLCNTIIEESLKQILVVFQKYCIEFNIKFVYVSVDSCDFIINLVLQKAGFRYILTWIDGIFKSSDKLPEITETAEVGIIKPDEIGYFKKISSLYYFKGGRFYLDANFNKELVDKMYAALITFSFKNNYIMLVYRIKNQPVGLFICKKIVTYESFSSLLVAPLRFLIINPEFRDKKVAYNLFIKTLEYLKDKSDLITTGLDVHNLLSLNLHLKVGFRFNYTHNVYHWWNVNL